MTPKVSKHLLHCILIISRVLFVADAKPTEMFTLDEHFLAQSVSRTSSKDSLLSCKIPLKFVRWQDTFSLTIFITGSQGGDYVRLHDIQIFGQGFLAP